MMNITLRAALAAILLAAALIPIAYTKLSLKVTVPDGRVITLGAER